MTVATAVRERPILFSGPMVRAILDGRKTVTRRVVNLRGEELCSHDRGLVCTTTRSVRCPYGQPGDRLWVRETWADRQEDPNDGDHRTYRWVYYRATPHEGFRVEPDRAACTYLHPSAEPERVAEFVAFTRWRPSIHMPRWASRISLEVTDVRVERVQEITPADAVAEGSWPDPDYQPGFRPDAHKGVCVDGEFIVERFRQRWDALNAARGYGFDANPWVWVIGIRRIA